MPKSAQEGPVRMAVSTINARQSCSETPSTANTLWAGDALGFTDLEAPLGRKKKNQAAIFDSLLLQFSLRQLQRASPRMNPACQAGGDITHGPGGSLTSLTTLLRCTAPCMSIFYYSHSFFNFCVFHHALPDLFCFQLPTGTQK